jgi:RNA polymerase sigma factor (sigma-70 family)
MSGAILQLTSRDVRKIGFSAARRIVTCPEDIEDAVQDGYLQVLQSRSPFRQESSITTWFHRIVSREALRKVRHDRAKMRDTRLVRHIEDAAFVRTVDPDSEEQVLLQERASRVLQAVNSLSLKKREAVLAAYYEYPDLSVVEVARIIGLSEKALESRLYWSRKELGVLLENL